MASQLKAQEARDRVAELESELASIRAVEVGAAHMPWSTQEFGNGFVELDVDGNIVRVVLTEAGQRFHVVEP